MVQLSKSLTGAVVTKAIGILLIVCMAECAAGSCLSYGHSCWGAHGKRSSSPNVLNPLRPEGVIPISDDKWFFLKLLRADGKRPPLDGSNEVDRFQQRRRFRDNDGVDERREFLAGKTLSAEYSDEDVPEKSPLEVIVEDSRPADKLNLLQILKDTSATYP